MPNNYFLNLFQVNLDVQQFKPDELTVKTVNDYVVIEGKHEERKDEHGFISRQFQRRYKLPSDIDPDTVVSQLSSDGVLTISAPKKALPQTANEKVIPITQTQTPAIKSDTAKADEPQKMES
jgi:crystallin alpha B